MYPGSHVIVDHYGLDCQWESNINCESMTVIDDLADRHHKCSLLIDQSLKKWNLEFIEKKSVTEKDSIIIKIDKVSKKK